jgi:hypothetical protein
MFQYPSSFMTMQGLKLLMLSRISFTAGDGTYTGTSTILMRYEAM